MKRKFSLLGGILISLPVIAVSCNNTQNQTNNNGKNKSNEIAVLKVWNENFKDKLNSAQSYEIILNKLIKLLNGNKDLKISLANQNDLKKRFSKDIEAKLTQKLALKVNNNDLLLEAGKVAYGQQATKYKDPKTGEIKETLEKDLSKLKEFQNVKEITQIGFYDDEWNNYLTKHGVKYNYIQMVKLPKSVNKVPSVLPEEITALIEVFRGNTNAKIEGIEAWNTKNIMNTKGLFSYTQLFDGNISKWDVSSVTNMHDMFNGAKSFNQDISKWQTKNLKYLYRTFSRAEKFNQDISNWDVSNVARFSRVLYGAKSFNQDLSKWDINITRLAKFPGDKTGYDDWNKKTLIENEKSKWPLNLQNVKVSIGNK